MHKCHTGTARPIRTREVVDTFGRATRIEFLDTVFHLEWGANPAGPHEFAGWWIVEDRGSYDRPVMFTLDLMTAEAWVEAHR